MLNSNCDPYSYILVNKRNLIDEILVVESITDTFFCMILLRWNKLNSFVLVEELGKMTPALGERKPTVSIVYKAIEMYACMDRISERVVQN